MIKSTVHATKSASQKDGTPNKTSPALGRVVATYDLETSCVGPARGAEVRAARAASPPAAEVGGGSQTVLTHAISPVAELSRSTALKAALSPNFLNSVCVRESE